MANLIDLLKQSQELKRKQKELKAEMKSQKMALAVEFTSSVSPEMQSEQIARAEKILQVVKGKARILRWKFKDDMKKLREEAGTAKEILSLVNHEQTHGLPKRKQSMSHQGNTLIYQREGLKEIRIDTSKENWRATLKEELKKQGINGDNRIADNILYDAKVYIEEKIKVAENLINSSK